MLISKMKKEGPLKFEYSKITNYIYIGTNQCCQIGFNKKLIKEKIKADVSLEAELIDSPYGIEYYLWIPVKDTHSPTQKQLEIGVNFIANLVKDKIKVFVHCQRGHGRSPTLVAAYLISKGKSVDEAIEIIKKKRPAIHPNKFQMNALKKFEEKLI